MGGRKPTSPKIVPGQPPIGDRVFMGGSADFDEQTGKYRSTGTRRPPRKGPVRGLRFIGTPPPGYEFDKNDRLVKRGGGDPRAINIRRPSRLDESGIAVDPVTGKIVAPSKVRRGGRRGRRRRGGMNSCPDPSMLILMSDETQKKAGDLVVGDSVKTYHEKSFELGNYEVEFVDIIKDVEKIKMTFDGSEIICSLTHKFYVDNTWKEAKDMVVGDVVSDKKLIAIEKVEDGDVVHITVKDAHTYICEGLLSHNKRFAPGYPRPPKDRPRVMPYPKPRPRPTKDDLGPPPEREVPIPRERIRPITRESDPRGGAPFAPDERGMARDRFFERMFDRAEEAKQRKSMQKEERREIRQARNEERRARRNEPGEINVGDERQEIRRSMREERRARRNEPGEIDVGGEIDINAERGGRRRRRRDFTRRRSRMQGGRQGRSREERAAFRDRYVSTLRGGFFS